MRMIPDEFVSKLTVAGTLDECGAQLEQLLARGIQHPLLTPVPATEGGELEILDSCVRALVPQLRPVA